MLPPPIVSPQGHLVPHQADYLKEELYALVQTSPDIFEFLQASSLDGIWYWDIEKPENEWMSPEFKHLFGYEDHEIPNTSDWWQKNLSPGQLDEVLALFNAHIADPNVPYDQIVSYQHKDGSLVWVRCRGMAIRDDQGKPVRMLGCHTDITALKNAELELQRRVEELELANRELQDFASIISHDLQEPLRKINIFTELFHHQLGTELDEQSQKYLDHVQQTAQRMSLMIRDMAEYTRLARTSHDSSSVNLEDTLQDVLFDLEARIESSRAQITHSPLPSVLAQPMQMYQLFLNLINNAIKFSKPDTPPKITLSASPLPNNMTCITIEDEGIGFDAERYGELIFKPFKRLHKRSDYEGTGIGLAACKKIVEHHDGAISAESTPGEGARFLITLPTPSQP